MQARGSAHLLEKDPGPVVQGRGDVLTSQECCGYPEVRVGPKSAPSVGTRELDLLLWACVVCPPAQRRAFIP